MTEAVAVADTNIFVRWLMKDDARQLAAVNRVFERVAAGKLRLFVTSVTIAELVWVLESSYCCPKTLVHGYIRSILRTPGIELEDSALVLEALSMYADLNIDFADAYYIAWMRANRIDTVYTFDKKHFSRVGGLKVMSPS